MSLDLYQILLFLHLLCFVYWLGGDLGVFYSSGILIKPGLSKESRNYVLKVMHWLDQFPRVCMPLVIALGFTMGSIQWFELSMIWLIIIWTITFFWIYFVITLFLNKSSDKKTTIIRKVDLLMRWVVALVITFIAIASLSGLGITEDKWLATKLLIWAATVFCGIASRYTMKPFSEAFTRIMSTGETPEDISQLKKSLYITRIPILSIWFLVGCAGAIGVWKPF
jgi:hypothetical protein